MDLWINLMTSGRNESEIDWTPLIKKKFEIFQQSREFKQDPCTFEFYLEMYNEFTAKNHGGLTLTDYYSWYHKSLKNLVDESTLQPEVAAAFTTHVQRFQDRPQDEIVGRFELSYSIHPRHRDLYCALLGELLAKGEST